MKSIIIIVALFFYSCGHPGNITSIKPGNPVQVEELPATCPYFTKDNKGNILLSWVRTNKDSSFTFCYAISSDDGRSFGKTIMIASSSNIQPHSENLPKIIVKPSGEMMALWGAANPNPENKYSGLVFYSQSFDEGKTWSTAKTLVNDTASFDQRYYDVALLPNNEVAVIWLDNRKITDKEGSGLYFAVSKGRNGFTQEKMISENCCQCCRTDIFVDSESNIHVLYRGIINDSIRDMVHIVSENNGKNFSTAKRISNDNWVINGCPHTGPAMTENKEGLHFAWFTGGRNKGCFYTRSNDNGNSFIQPDRISPLGSHPQIASFPDGELLVVWDESVQVNNKYYKRIGVQKRSSAGASGAQAFITADTMMATYPVVAALKDNASLIAYTMNKAGKNYIMYQRLSLE